MKILKHSLQVTIALLLFSNPALSQLIFQDDFAAGSSTDWATRLVNGASVQFSGALILTTDVFNAQPVAAYRSFNSVSLLDGEVLRMTFDLSASSPSAHNTFPRFALGFANPLITGTSGNLAVPLAGYHASLPIKTTYPQIVNWVNASEATPLNFFNSATAMVGVGPWFPAGVSVTSVPKPVVWEIARIGSDLTFSGSLDGTSFSAGSATGANVLPDFKFNTVGLAYGYEGNTSATYDNFRLEVVPEPSTVALLLGGLMVTFFAIKRRHAKGRA